MITCTAAPYDVYISATIIFWEVSKRLWFAFKESEDRVFKFPQTMEIYRSAASFRPISSNGILRLPHRTATIQTLIWLQGRPKQYIANVSQGIPYILVYLSKFIISSSVPLRSEEMTAARQFPAQAGFIECGTRIKFHSGNAGTGTTDLKAFQEWGICSQRWFGQVINPSD